MEKQKRKRKCNYYGKCSEYLRKEGYFVQNPNFADHGDSKTYSYSFSGCDLPDSHRSVSFFTSDEVYTHPNSAHHLESEVNNCEKQLCQMPENGT